MENLTFYNSKDQAIKVSLKPFISADMITETTRILRKYQKTYDAFIDRVMHPEFDIDTLSDTEYLKYKYLWDTIIHKPHLTAFDKCFKLYEQEMCKELLSIIIDVPAITNKEVLEMLNNADLSL